jgi:hypothetical protein
MTMNPVYLDKQAMMSLSNDLLEKPSSLSTPSRYTVWNGGIYLGTGVLLILWPGVTQTLLMERAFVGSEQGLIRVIGLTVFVIGWLYLFGGLSGGRQVVAASVIDRLIFVPVVALPLAISGVFPHLLVLFTVLDMTLAIGAWLLIAREKLR